MASLLARNSGLSAILYRNDAAVAALPRHTARIRTIINSPPGHSHHYLSGRDASRHDGAGADDSIVSCTNALQDDRVRSDPNIVTRCCLRFTIQKAHIFTLRSFRASIARSSMAPSVQPSASATSGSLHWETVCNLLDRRGLTREFPSYHAYGGFTRTDTFSDHCARPNHGIVPNR
jgi:hypothetical protein